MHQGGSSASIVIGPLRSGKAVLSHELQRHFQEEATVLVVQAGLFLNQAQFLDAVLEQVPEQVPVCAFSLVVADIVTYLVYFAELGLAPEDFTIQLMGSRSEQGVIDFQEGAELPFASGYFETRYQGGPWFVAVTRGLSSCEVANASLASLFPAILELRPWVRPASQFTLPDQAAAIIHSAACVGV